MAFFGSEDWSYAETGITDEDAVFRARTGDDRAAEWLFMRYRSLVERQARTFYVAGADHDDVVQEGMMGLWKAIRDFRSDKLPRFAPFAELCVTRQIISAVKTATRHKHCPLNEYVSLNKPIRDDGCEVSLLDLLPDRACTNPEEVLMEETEGPVRLPDGLENSLSPLEMYVVQGYLASRSYHDIAGELTCGTKSVDNALQRAKKKIKKLLTN